MDDADAPVPFPPATVDRLVDRLESGDRGAVADLMPIVYEELRRLARRYVRQERAQSVQATDLVHEAYLRLARDRPQRWQGRTHFLAIAAIGMRRLLVERARARGAAKRGGDRVQVTLEDALVADPGASVDLLALDGALSALAAFDARQAHIVELRFFGGLTVEETAGTIGVSPATVKRDWTLARAWLKRELGAEPRGAERDGGS
jgi:RNA polymerase sigma factor (TIGR02999 family)